jgi:hypothetical protein
MIDAATAAGHVPALPFRQGAVSLEHEGFVPRIVGIE